MVGTPGRIKALVLRKDLDLSNLKIFILDECDKMLEESGKLTQIMSDFLTRHEI